MSRRRSDRWIVRACLASSIAAIILSSAALAAMVKFYLFVSDLHHWFSGSASAHTSRFASDFACPPCTIQNVNGEGLLLALAAGALPIFVAMVGAQLIMNWRNK